MGVGYNGMPHGCNDDDLPWGKSSKADPLDTKVFLYNILLLTRYLKLLHNQFHFIFIFSSIYGIKYMYVCHAEMNAIMNKISANVEGKSKIIL